MNLSPILKLFNQIPTYNTFTDAIYLNKLTEEMYRPLGVLTAARPALLAALQADLQRPILFITARADRARILTEQIQVWASDPAQIYRLPDPDALPHEKVFWGSETVQGRLAALSALVSYPQQKEQTQDKVPPMLVTSARALMQHTLPHHEFTMMDFKVGQRIKLNEVVAQWVDMGYQPEDVVEVAGSFSRRGGILDIFPPNMVGPIRIELFGDEIDSLRRFDPATQRSEQRLKSFTVGPATETLPRQAPSAADRLSQWDLSNLQPGTKINFEEDIERLSHGTTFKGIEYYLPFFYNSSNGSSNEQASSAVSVLDYLPDDALIFIEDPQELAGVVDELELQARSLKKELTTIGDLPSLWPDPYFSWPTLATSLAARKPFILGFNQSGQLVASSQSLVDSGQLIVNSEQAINDEGRKTKDKQPTQNPEPGTLNSPLTNSYFFNSTFVVGPAFGGQVKNVLPEIIKRKNNSERVILVSRQSARLSHLLNEFTADQTVTPLDTFEPDDPPPPSGSITLLHGMLIEGWSLQNEVANNQSLITVMSDSELFGWKKPTTTRRPKPRKGITPETFFADVNPGDMVVHIEHGMGRYVGLVKLDFDTIEREYLAVQYANADKLYVPIYQADRLARYVGVDEHNPTLSRLGAADWNTVKRKAKKAVEDIAKELLEIYAKREIAKGFAFSPDTEWQTDIEDAFPYVETDDQLRAIAEVKVDMEKNIPMDRLVCGDVGYGKTEVALRAAFKAVMDGKQVAVLAPTTVLAQQHLHTFQTRMAVYPLHIEALSRFRTKSQQEKTILNLASGTVDIVIGTHRLLQKDVVFNNLGLLVIDEEQRFGVKQKERLKTLRTEIDVLTLTATPIPRTLHMSLSGARNLSTIDTPPEERLPVQTIVTEYDEAQIRSAILRELDRGGQVFYVYNRVMGIEQKANRIRNLVPQAEVGIGHGQMSERQLERVMISFIDGETDILVSTTIIENGLDLPNANTIIIDRADRMGLSQLYQLRGRVGRGAVQAYAYLLTPKHFEPTPEARKRLAAIAEASELGAGFRIAMRDLEIRGAGDFLGAKQHGHIAAVGFDLYTRLLAQAVKDYQGEGHQGDGPQSSTIEDAIAYLNPLSEGIQLNLPIPAYVPEDYLPEEKLRFRLYRRLAGITSLAGIAEMAKELEDRFGHMPEPVANLLFQLKLKLLAIEGGVQSVVTETGQLVVRAESLENIDRNGLARRLGSAIQVTRRQVTLPLHPNQEVWEAELEKTLRLISRMINDPAR